MSRDKTETRTRILNASWKLLEAAKGQDVRMSDIAKEAGVSRQAVYLHFPARADLLIATTRHLDEVKDIDARLAKSRAAEKGIERLEAFIDAWGNYIPEIYGVGKALMVMMDSDDAAAQAWTGRMLAVRDGCTAAVKALKRDGTLSPEHTAKTATDILSTMLSVQNWEQYRYDCGWSQKQYIQRTKALAHAAIVRTL